MSFSSSLLAVTVGSVLAGAPPDSAPAAVEPAPAAVEPAPAPAPAPVPASASTPADYDDFETPRGLGSLIAGPLVIAIGIPFAFLGNGAWREACGPDTTARECARGSTLSTLGHTVAGLAFAGGITLTAIGARRYGMSMAENRLAEGRRTNNKAGLIVAGAIVLPGSLIALGLVRLFFWLPTPECQTARCVSDYQTTSTAIVSGLALTSGLGAGMMMYGFGYNRAVRKAKKVAILPQAGRGYAGLRLTGEF